MAWSECLNGFLKVFLNCYLGSAESIFHLSKEKLKTVKTLVLRKCIINKSDLKLLSFESFHDMFLDCKLDKRNCGVHYKVPLG